MLRRFLSLILILTLCCVELPAALCSRMGALAEVAEDVPVAEDAEAESESSFRTLQRGDRDGDDSADIVALQNRLIELGYLRDAADGVYGANTQDAVSALQRSNDLEETGVATPELQALLYSDAELVSASNSMDSESVTFRVQDKLAVWGFLADEPDGVAGSNTSEAVAEFKTYLRVYLRLHPTPSPEPDVTPAPAERTGYGKAAHNMSGCNLFIGICPNKDHFTSSHERGVPFLISFVAVFPKISS